MANTRGYTQGQTYGAIGLNFGAVDPVHPNAYYYTVPGTDTVLVQQVSANFLNFQTASFPCAGTPHGITSTAQPYAVGQGPGASTLTPQGTVDLPDVIVACSGDDTVKVFDPQGNARATISLNAGTHPESVAVIAFGGGPGSARAYVTCPGTSEIAIIRYTGVGPNPYAVSYYATPTPNSTPFGIAPDSGGTYVWFTEQSSAQIGRMVASPLPLPWPPGYTPFNEYTFPTANSQPTSIARDGNGNFWFTEVASQKIGRIDFNGNTIEFDVDNPTHANLGLFGIGLGTDGNMWFTETNQNVVGVISTGLDAAGNTSNMLRGTQATIRVQQAALQPKGVAAYPQGGRQAFTTSPAVGMVTGLIQNNSTLGERALTLNVATPPFTGTAPLPTLGPLAPAGMVEDGSGNVWVAQFYSNSIARFLKGQNGSATPFPISAGVNDDKRPLGMCLGPDGNIWFTENQVSNPTLGAGGNAIGRMTPTGTVTEFPIPTADAGPTSICVGPDGNLWFCENVKGKIGRCTPAGVITEFPLPSSTSYPQTICAGPDGKLWFTEQSGNKIGRITTAGVIDAEFSTGLTASSQPYGIAQGPDGAGGRCLWFTEKAAGKIGRITTAGVITEYQLATQTCAPGPIVECSDGNMWFTELLASYANNQLISNAAIGAIRPLTTQIQEFPLQTVAPATYGMYAGTGGGAYVLFTETNCDKYGRVDFNF